MASPIRGGIADPGAGPMGGRLSRGGRARSARRVSAVVGAALPVVLVAAVALGTVPVAPLDVAVSVGHHLFGVPLGATGAVDDLIVWQFRVPRVLLAFLAGASLAIAGAVLQTVIRNPLADPYVLGIASGASLAAVSVMVFGVAGLGVLGWLGVSGAAFVGASGTLALVLVLGRRHGRVDPSRLVLAGVAVAYLMQAGTSLVQLLAAPDQLQNVVFWLLGSVAQAQWGQLAIPAIAITGCTVWLVTQGRRLNALMMGDDLGAALGLNLSAFRTGLLVVSALLTATVVAVAGGVGFVGLIAPHFVRLLVGADHRRTLPLTAMIGGGFLVLADLAGRTLAAPLELPLSIITAAVGVPVFLLTLLRPRAGVS